MKTIPTEEAILGVAKEEFLQYGYMEASMRRIASKAGCTTGMLYYRFKDKDEIFKALVKDGADLFEGEFMRMQKNFQALPDEVQVEGMFDYAGGGMEELNDILYAHFDAFKLIVCSGGGSSYEGYIERLVDAETQSTFRFINTLRSTGHNVPPVKKEMCHMLASAMLNGIFEVIAHDFSKEDAKKYIYDLRRFFSAGWGELFGMEYHSVENKSHENALKI